MPVVAMHEVLLVVIAETHVCHLLDDDVHGQEALGAPLKGWHEGAAACFAIKGSSFARTVLPPPAADIRVALMEESSRNQPHSAHLHHDEVSAGVDFVQPCLGYARV